MKNIVIPTNDQKGLKSKLAEHFGRCSTYTFLNEKGEIIKIIDNTSSHRGGEKLPPKLMKDNSADILLCQGIGIKAINLCQEIGIDVYVFQAKTVEEIFNLWKNNKNSKASSLDACKK